MSDSSVFDSGHRIRRAIQSEGRVTALFAVGGLCLVAAFALFLLNSTAAVFPVAGFVAVSGYGWYAHQAETARALTFLSTASTIIILGLITVFVFLEAVPVFQLMGVRLFGYTDPIRVFGITVLPAVESYWSTSQHVYSLVPMIWGTFVTTAIATLIAAPLGIAAAVFLAEIAPPTVRETVKPGVEILAGVPSIVYGYLGFVTLNSFLFENLEMANLGSLFLVGLVIGVMALPTVVSVADDALTSVPASMRDGAIAMGSTEWQTVKSITLPAALSGVSAAVLLGLGRAVGETMAATVILGHSQQLPDPLQDVFDNTETLTSLIASQYGNADGLHMNALFTAGVVLFVTVMFLSLVARRIELRMQRKLGGGK
ncbi:phosphate ABC transporter permease subunit PstC [Haloarcula salinisoli]|uniref:Phosphate transport system permease protein n=1 Tax=Haloarcula salinisoli TaxID=2487746 RepID=A0A8J8C8J3_9EURY|nr:phosphate ABC transporter permease subunit PstC [Halomicroarcula salinisoli]MBX0287177.1 phosphate ABC transporter permease subunit PstC [Halomicroarcula salinisoli]MBX0304481.1 phosphate ABC transporter permease subunit PstC [Halomicroarcula salinisoli]